MNLAMDLRVLAAVIGLLAVFQIFPILLAWAFGEPMAPYLLTLAVCGTFTLVSFAITQGAPPKMRPRDGILVVFLGWYLSAILGGLPFIFSGHMGWVDAFFETASGLTTTGSSILKDIEVLPQSLLFWRSFVQWIGGMGMIMFTVAILPFLGVGGMQLMKAEVPGITKDRLAPRMVTTARYLWGGYVVITLLNILAYWGSDMSLLDAVNHAFTTMATGGFSTRNASMAAFSPAAQWWAALFMTMAGANSALYYLALTGRGMQALKDVEFHYYAGIILLVGFGVGITLMNLYGLDLELAMRQSFFQTVTIMTTTGYASTDWETWPEAIHLVFMCLMFVGGMAGSTAGGIKVVRLAVLTRLFSTVTRRMIHPNQIVVPKLGNNDVTPAIMEACTSLAALAVWLISSGAVVLAALGMDLISALSASLTAFANVGPGLGSVGPMDNFSGVPEAGKILLACMMIVGRLEIFTVLIVLNPRFWRS